ncbi:MAG: MFS transporter, partial [Dehalococcoidia bacterium]|nr:MFS transporter [Dehalococcoidia bacterium]
MITLGIGAFMGTLDGSIVNTVLPVIRQSFGTDLSSIEWVVMAYLLVMSIFLLSFGRLGDILGYKRVYNIGLIVFTIGSILCGLSPTEGFLIGFRA